MFKDITYSCIYAASINNVMGVDGKLPWRVPEDLKFFNDTTKGKICIMGLKTYLSMKNFNKFFADRKCIVITSSQQNDDRVTFLKLKGPKLDKIRDLKYYIEQLCHGSPERVFAYFIGGAELISTLGMALSDFIYVTTIYTTVDTSAGNEVTYIDNVDENQFKLTVNSAIYTSKESQLQYQFQRYTRKPNDGL